MASLAYDVGKQSLMNGDVDLDTDVIKATLLMNNTTADTENTVTTLDGFTTLAICDSGGGYDWTYGGDGRKTLTLSITTTDGQAQAEVSGSTTTWASILPSTNPIKGIIIFKQGSADDTDAIPICWIEFTSEVTLNGLDFVVTWSGDQMMVLT